MEAREAARLDKERTLCDDDGELCFRASQLPGYSAPIRCDHTELEYRNRREERDLNSPAPCLLQLLPYIL